MSAIVRELAESMCRQDPARRVTFNIADGVVGDGDPVLLRAVLQNLMENAWKFTSPKPSATIEFGMTFQEGETVYFVRDDGVGFDMNYVDKLFGAFQRLHRSTEFEGTGIGLATVHRIIHRHGGRVWANGVLDKGATFHFTLQPERRGV
jgi:light-regulated signal transduction histidine kinase (bacteriophytochrome)